MLRLAVLALSLVLFLPTTVNAGNKRMKGLGCRQNSECKSGNCIPREGENFCHDQGKRRYDRRRCICG